MPGPHYKNNRKLEKSKGQKLCFITTLMPFEERHMYNNDFGSADKIKVGKTVYGSLAEKNTEDYFYLKPSKGGKYKVSISLNRDMEYGYRLSIYDYSRNRIATTDQLIFKKGSLMFSAKKGKKYYITIEQGNTWSGYSVGYLYKLKVVKK